MESEFAPADGRTVCRESSRRKAAATRGARHSRASASTCRKRPSSNPRRAWQRGSGRATASRDDLFDRSSEAVRAAEDCSCCGRRFAGDEIAKIGQILLRDDGGGKMIASLDEGRGTEARQLVVMRGKELDRPGDALRITGAGNVSVNLVI